MSQGNACFKRGRKPLLKRWEAAEWTRNAWYTKERCVKYISGKEIKLKEERLIKQQWDEQDYLDLQAYLLSLKEKKYRDFHQKLIPDVQNLIGIRVPKLKKMAQLIIKGNALSYLNNVKHQYYEETMLQGLVIGNLSKASKANPQIIWEEVMKFLPFVDNWAVCDSFCANFKMAKRYKVEIFECIGNLLASEKEFYQRTGFVLLMDYYMEPEYLSFIFEVCVKVKSEAYYVKMAKAWLLSTCFIKYERETMDFLDKKKLDCFTYRMTLQKIIDSGRVKEEMKEQIRMKKKV